MPELSRQTGLDMNGVVSVISFGKLARSTIRHTKRDVLRFVYGDFIATAQEKRKRDGGI